MAYQPQRGISILLAEDDEDDRMLMRDALRRINSESQLYFVEDGEELMDYLRRQGRYSDTADDNPPWPQLLLLDLNMPRKGGREALAEIKADTNLRELPIVVLTTSGAMEDIRISYALGANSFITKPTSYTGLVSIMKMVCDYWIGTVQLPSENGTSR